MNKKLTLLLGMVVILAAGCFPYVYYEQKDVLLEGIDIDQTLEIAKVELDEGGFDAVLTIWAIRDQIITSEQAAKISEIYLKSIDNIDYKKDTDREFGMWHFAWAVSDFYRNGNEEIKAKLLNVYQDAVKRPDTLDKFNKIANTLINGDKIYMGDIHGLGRAYAKSHIVIPGNKEYVQSFDEFIKNKQKKTDKAGK